MHNIRKAVNQEKYIFFFTTRKKGKEGRKEKQSKAERKWNKGEKAERKKEDRRKQLGRILTMIFNSVYVEGGGLNKGIKIT